ncbi:hypothetical protein OIO89_00795 (plasmid) [Mycobacterium ulcerans]|nr:hypothetical protein OIO89_00795 [Mycobacterium ulcerans]
MKRVSAGDIVVGDWVYRIIGSADPSAPAGEYMMVIAAIDKDTYEGTTIYRVSGDVYALRGEGAAEFSVLGRGPAASGWNRNVDAAT